VKILVTGRGSSGSWKVRGEQIGSALRARVTPLAGLDDMRHADVILVVKRVPEQLLANLRRSGRPWVYDVVDAYPQPDCTAWTRDAAVRWLLEHLQRLRPNGVIFPNAQMLEDYGGAGAVVYHHARPGIERNPVRERIRTIGYEGSERYLDGWIPAINLECERRGYSFAMNPRQLADIDVVLALRGPARNGYAQKAWKSNVKLANAHASGTPFVGGPERSYIETATGREYFVGDAKGLGIALDWLEPRATRAAVHEAFTAATITLETTAAQTRAALLECVSKS
jgi:hypothetical protein